MSSTLVSLDAIRDAREVIAGRLHRTPTIGSAYFSERFGVDLRFKMELFQKTGSFKARGVLNTLHRLAPEERRRGVISLSAGNHAQALAWGAHSLGVSATIVMPSSASRGKIEATRGYGGEVVLTDGDLLATCLEIQRARTLTLVHPFDHPHVIAGTGTVGYEIVEDVPSPDLVLVAVGGGGLISGVAAAVKMLHPAARVLGVEPEGADAMRQSLARGEPVRLARIDTIADGLAAPFAGVHNLAHVQAFVDEMVLVTDREITDALFLILERCKVVVEPAAAAAFAPLLSGRVTAPAGARVVCVLSGGNLDRDKLRRLLA